MKNKTENIKFIEEFDGEEDDPTLYILENKEHITFEEAHELMMECRDKVINQFSSGNFK